MVDIGIVPRTLLVFIFLAIGVHILLDSKSYQNLLLEKV
jgi:hypothetical protein